MIDLTKDNFDLEVLDEATPVIVDFWATWCGPCQMATPILEDLDKVHQNKVKFGKVNVDDESPLAQRFGIMSIPTVILFKDGNEVERVIGFNGKEGYEKLLRKAI